MKPILFNTEMVRAILEGRKSVTRRVVKPQMEGWGFDGLEENPAMIRYRKSGEEYPADAEGLWACFEWGGYPECPLVKAPYRPGDILYVRETWNYGYCDTTDFESRYNETFFEELTPGSQKGTYLMPKYFYRTEDLDGIVGMKWHPSIHMPKQAARLFLRVTDVRVERLIGITDEDLIKECGVDRSNTFMAYGTLCWIDHMNEDRIEPLFVKFWKLWDSTIKKANLPIYGWVANPWVWVIAFERIDKEAALYDAG